MLRETLYSIANDLTLFPMSSRLRLSALGIFVLAVVFGCLYWLTPPPEIRYDVHDPAQFTLVPIEKDAAGIAPKTSFRLTSSQPLSEERVKKIVTFDPAVAFRVRSEGDATGLILHARAKGEGTGSGYLLEPEEELSGGKIYKAQISDPQVADRAYAWAFQVKAPFQVMSTHPGNKTNHVPVHTGIEVKFNREGLKDAQKHFGIVPEVKGKFETHGDTLIFIPRDPLKDATVYTVTIAAGITNETSEDATEQEYVLRFETEKRETGSGAVMGSLFFQSDLFEVFPSRNPILSVSTYSLDPNVVETTIRRFESSEAFMRSYRDSRDWALLWSEYAKTGKAHDHAGAAAMVATFKGGITSAGYQTLMEVPQKLEAGYYLAEARVPGQEEGSFAWFQVTPLARHYSYTHDKGVAWIYDFEQKAPVSSATVSFVSDAQTKSKLGSTDAKGLATFTTPDILRKEAQEGKEYSPVPRFLTVEKSGYQALVVDVQNAWGGVSRGDRHWKYLTTDRPVYQMTDTVKFWGVVKGREEDLRNQKVKVSLYSDYFGWWEGSKMPAERDMQPLRETEVTISPFDTIAGEFSFAGLSPSTYSLVVSQADRVITISSIQVLTYTKPAYTISVTPSTNAIFAGTPMSFRVKATFFEGTPVPRLKLHYNSYWQTQIQGQIELDDNGEATIPFTPPYDDNAVVYMYPGTADFTFTPVLSEEAHISGSGMVSVFGSHMYAQLDNLGSTGGLDSTGGEQRFRAKLNTIVLGRENMDFIGDPVTSSEAEARIVRQSYIKRETGTYDDPVTKLTHKTYDYQPTESVMETLRGTTNEKGEWTFGKYLKQEENVWYRIELSARDGEGRTARAQTYAYFGASNMDANAASPIVMLSINSDPYRKEFSVGQSVRLELSRSGKPIGSDEMVLWQRVRNNIEWAQVESGPAHEEPFKEAFLPSAQYRAVLIGPYGFEETNLVTAAIRINDRKLDVSLSAKKESYRPGETITLDVAVQDNNKKAVGAEINVAAVDEAVFGVLPYSYQTEILSGLLRDVFVYPISSSTRYISPTGRNGPAGGGAEKGGCFLAGTRIATPEGTAMNIEDIRVGDRVVTFRNEQDRTHVVAIVQGTSSHDVDDYLVINDALRVTVEHPLLINGAWKAAGLAQKGDYLLNKDGKTVAITTIQRVIAPKTRVYNLTVGTTHTYFADGFYAHNAEKGGSPRRDFKDTALFTSVRAGSDGKASVAFKAPDNLTSWRVTARVFDPRGMFAGEGIALVPVRLPFFVDATISDTYLSGDQPTIRVRSFGTEANGGEETTFTVGMKETGFSQTAKGKGSVSVPLPVSKEGNYTLAVKAKQGAHEDILERNLRIVTSFFSQRQDKTKPVTAGEGVAISERQEGIVEITFADTGRGKWHGALSGAAFPSFSLSRSDSIVAEHIAEGLLAQYFPDPQRTPPPALDLTAYHHESGALRLFSYGDPDLVLSALVSDAAPEAVFQTKLKEYFLSSLRDGKADISRICSALYGLAALGEPVLSKLQALSAYEDLTVADATFVALGMEKLGDREGARGVYEASIQPKIRRQEPWAYIENNDETKRVKQTALVAMLASRLGLSADTDLLWAYLQTHFPPRDLDSLERALLLRSELAKPGKVESAQFAYQTKDRKEDVKLEHGQTKRIELLADEARTLRFANVQGQASVVMTMNIPTDPSTLRQSNEIALIRSYTVNGKPVTTFTDGDVVKVTLTPEMSKQALDGSYQIVDYLPQGLRPITRPYVMEWSYGTDCHITGYADRIVGNAVYFSIWRSFPSDQYCPQRTISYYARVVSKGTYTAHPALLQSQVDPTYLTLSPPTKVEVR